MTKQKDTNIPQASGQGAIEAVIADSVSAAASDKTTDATSAVKKKKSHGGRNFILFVLLIVVAVFGSLALSGKLAPLYESVTARLHHISTQLQAQKQVKIVTIKPDLVKTMPPTAVEKPVVTPQPVIADQTERKTGVSFEEVRALLSSIAVLRDELQQMSDSQQALQNGLKEQQQMNLQVRLRWIADPASRLPQLQLAWEEISLLPGLSDEQRSEAVRMSRLAGAHVQQLKQWQDALSKWADALITPVHRNILPKPAYPWLAWIVSQFQLRQAPSVEARHLADLRARLLNAARHLTLESWPAKGAWQRLQAELLLQIRAIHHDGGDVSGEAIETGLPESFNAIQTDINTLRRTALQWQQRGEQ